MNPLTVVRAFSRSDRSERRIAILLLVLLITTAACGRKVQAVLPVTVPSPPAEDEVAYRDGLRAFREATPDGFLRATIAFRKAAALKKTSCEYVLHLGESLLFLAQQQKTNWEEFQPQVAEANTILLFKQGAPECRAFESYLTRLKALSMGFEGLRVVEVAAMARRAIDLDPEDPMNWIVLAQLVPEPPRGEPRAPIQRAAELRPDLPLVQYELGNYYLRTQNTYPKAKVSFERVLENSPSHFQAIIGIVYALSIEGDDAAELVEPLLLKAVELGPTSLRARTLLGEHYAGLEETDRAVEQYQAAVRQNSTYYPAHLAQGTTLATADRSSEAEESFDAVIKLDVRKPHPPHNGVDFTADGLAHYYLGNIRLERGDLAKARAEYNEALADISNYPAAIYGLGIVSYREGKVDEALMKLTQVIELEPRRFPNAYLARGGIRGERRQFSQAVQDLSQAIEIYKAQIVTLKARIKIDEEKGRKFRADGQRRRLLAIEAALEKAVEGKKAAEAQIPGGI